MIPAPFVAPRVKRPREDEQLVKELTSEQNAPFATIRDLLVFAAAFAFSKNADRRSFENSAEAIPFQIFENSGANAFIDMLALVVSGEHSILVEERLAERISIFEEFAASGLQLLRRELDVARNRTAVDVLRDLTLDQYSKSETKSETNLEHLLSELDG